MTTIRDTANVPLLEGIRTAIISHVDGATIPFTSDWVQFSQCDVCVALYGTATAVIAQVQRSAVDPYNAANTPQPVPVDTVSFNGNLSTGIVPNLYQEASIGWWRINVTTITGGNCSAALSGF